MTKAELVTQVALKTELTKQQSAEVVDLLLECIIKALQAGDKVELRGFGSFRRRDRRPRLGRNPKTGEVVAVSAQSVPFFKTGKRLQARLNPELSPSSS